MAIFNPNKRNKRSQRGRDVKRSTPQSETKTLQVHGLSHEAQGVAKDGDRVVFVEGALPEETVEARITEQRRRFALAQTLQVMQSSEHRVEPQCAHYDRCGGCQLQHLSTQQQLVYKQENLQHEFVSKLKLHDVPWQKPIEADGYGYRRRARIGIRYRHKTGEVVFGFREQKNSHLTDIQECPVLVDELQSLIPSLKSLLLKLEKVDVITQAQLLSGDELQVISLRIVKELPQADLKQLLAWAEEQAIQLDLQRETGTETLYTPPNRALWFKVAGQRIDFASDSFIQANASVNEQMVSTALQWLQVKDHETVLDLYAGLGNFTLPLAQQAETVCAVELDKKMVADLEQNAKRNGLQNVDVQLGNLDDLTSVERLSNADFIVLDPPRAGAAPIMPWVSQQKCRVLYVACEPSSLIRDAAVLLESGYKLDKVVALDMFPQTKHIETMALFTPPS